MKLQFAVGRKHNPSIELFSYKIKGYLFFFKYPLLIKMQKMQIAGQLILYHSVFFQVTALFRTFLTVQILQFLF